MYSIVWSTTWICAELKFTTAVFVSCVLTEIQQEAESSDILTTFGPTVLEKTAFRGIQGPVD